MWPAGKYRRPVISHTAAHQISQSRIATGISWDSPGVPSQRGALPASLGGTCAFLWLRGSTAPLQFASAPCHRPVFSMVCGPSLPLLVPLSPRRPDSCLLQFRLPQRPSACPGLTSLGQKLGADRRRSPVSVLVFLCSLAQPPVALTWAPQGALPAKQWRPGRRDPPSGRVRILANSVRAPRGWGPRIRCS